MVDNLARFARMAQRTRERIASIDRRAEMDLADYARRHGGAPEALPGEGGMIPTGEHRGHRTHIAFRVHGNGVICSCGALAGIFSYVAPSAEELAALPEACAVCEARGLTTR